MSSKVQGYLNRHKISSLFEHMMSALVKDMPSDPYDHLILIIKDTKQRQHHGVSSTEMAFSDTKTTTTSVWASSINHEYEKPWRTNSKKTDKTKKVSSSENPRKSWDKTVKITTKTFDDLHIDQPAGYPPAKALLTSHVEQVKEVLDVPQVSDCYVSEDDFLRDEISSSSKQSVKSQQTSEPANRTSGSTKQRGPKVDAVKHQKQLAEFVSRKKSIIDIDVDSGVSTNSDDEIADVDGAPDYVIAESAEDLADEGVNIKAIRGENVVKTTPITHAVVEPIINVSICANCAKVLHGDRARSSSQVSTSTKTSHSSAGTSRLSTPTSVRTQHSRRSQPKGAVSDLWQTHRSNPLDIPDQNPQVAAAIRGSQAPPDLVRKSWKEEPDTVRTGFSSYYAEEGIDDEFESVSQVSGVQPRAPVWAGGRPGELDGEYEDIRPVKGAHMISPRAVPAGVTRTTKQAESIRASGLSVTLKEDLLRQLPQSSDTVESFLSAGMNTWSGQKLAAVSTSAAYVKKSKPTSANGGNRGPSREPLVGGNSGGWKINYNSDDDSTLIP